MPKNPESLGHWLKPEKPEHILGFLLKSLQHTIRQRIDEALRKQGVELSFAQFAALINLHNDPGVTGARLARRAFVSAQTMNSALRALEQDGYIERRPHPSSRRADSWSLTNAGLAELARARQVGTAVFTRMLGGFQAKELAAFEDYLRRCIGALDEDSAAFAEASRRAAPRRRLTGHQRRQNAGVNNTRNV
jgi:DNA-binding MarR family transcriptional regulator